MSNIVLAKIGNFLTGIVFSAEEASATDATSSAKDKYNELFEKFGSTAKGEATDIKNGFFGAVYRGYSFMRLWMWFIVGAAAGIGLLVFIFSTKNKHIRKLGAFIGLGIPVLVIIAMFGFGYILAALD